MYWTGWVPRSCTGQAGCPVMYCTGWVPHSCLDRLGAQFMYWTVDRMGTQFMYRTGWVPSSCTGQAWYPVHVQERLGAQVIFKKGLPRSCSGKGCSGHVQDRVAQVMF